MPTNQIWKKPFKKTGYPAEEVEIDTSGKIIGDYIVLPRKFFRLAGTSALYLNPGDSQYKPASIGIDNEFLIARDIDQDLTDEIGIDIYTRIQLNHSNVANTILKITYNPFGDILDPEDFQQNLSPTADVIHNSLKLEVSLSSETLTTEYLEAETAVIESLTLESIQVNNVTIGSGPDQLRYDGKSGLLMINGNTFPHIAPDNLKQENTLTLLVLNPAHFLELVPVDFLKVDSINQDLSIQSINILNKLNELETRIIALEE